MSFFDLPEEKQKDILSKAAQYANEKQAKVMTRLNPGGSEAVKHGCTCAVIDNHYGEGVPVNGERQFWISMDCPLHGLEEDLP